MNDYINQDTDKSIEKGNSIYIEKVNNRCKYDSSIIDNRVYKLCLLGATDKDIVEIIGITESTFNEWKKQYPSLSESIKRGKRDADANVAESLYKKATGTFRTREVKETVDEKGNVKETVTTEKENMPDTIAQIFWLKNRDPNRWKDKQEVDNNINIKTLQILPPEDDIKELTEAEEPKHIEE